MVKTAIVPCWQYSSRHHAPCTPAKAQLLLLCWQVGDYVLSPDIVVERKALPDLFASLGSGRLYNQVRLNTCASAQVPGW